MKSFLRNFMLGVVLALPGALYAQDVPPAGTTPAGPYPPCCGGCNAAKNCPACKSACIAGPCLGGALAACQAACDAYSTGSPCLD